MTNTEHRADLQEPHDVHHDGFINLGSHADHLTETYGITVPEKKVPVSFFEMPSGQPSLEQVHVLNFFAQELRNVISTPISTVDILARLAIGIQSSDADSFRIRFTDQVIKMATHSARANFSVDEAHELILALSDVVEKIKTKDVPLISAQKRQDLVVLLEGNREKLSDEQRRLIMLLDGGTISKAEQSTLDQISRQLLELPLLLNHYRILSEAEITEELTRLEIDLTNVQDKVDQKPNRKNTSKLLELETDVVLYRDRAKNYYQYVQQQQTEPIISAEMSMLVTQFDLLKAGMEAYTLPPSTGRLSVQREIQQILSSPDARAALGSGLSS